MKNYTYQVLGSTGDGGGFPAHDGLLTTWAEALACLAACWANGDGWIDIKKDGQSMAHVCFRHNFRVKVFLFKLKKGL